MTEMMALPAALPWLRSLNARQRQANPPITSPDSPYSRAFDFSSLASWITPNPNFFIRSHFGVPQSPGSWTIKVHGAVERVLSLSLTDLSRMPAVEIPATLECAGNLVGWGGVSNAHWTGVSLAAILKESGIPTGSGEVVLIGADGGNDREAGGMRVQAFARSIPLSKALEPSTLLAMKMNGVVLPAEHGGPVRAVVPGFYGMDSVKWIREIFVSREPFTGFYQTKRYYETRRVNGRSETEPLHRMKIKSQFARPGRDEALSAGVTTVLGAAWSGEARIRSVGLSFDGGSSWQPARLGPEDEASTWRLWFYDWPATPGRHELIARAVDDRGDQQPLERDSRIITPYANNWADRRIITVR